MLTAPDFDPAVDLMEPDLLRNALETVHVEKQDPTRWTTSGICAAVETVLVEETTYEYPEEDEANFDEDRVNNALDDLSALFYTWPKHSGFNDWPVGTGYGDWREALALVRGLEAKPREDAAARMWDRNTSEYAALRWELLEHCLSVLGGEFQ